MSEYTPAGWFWKTGDYLYESASDTWWFISGNPWIVQPPGSDWKRLDALKGWLYIDGEYIFEDRLNRWWWIDETEIWGHDMKLMYWIKWLFTKTPKKLKPVKIYDCPSDTENIIGMIAVPGEDCVLAALARIGFGSGYKSRLIKIWPDGRNETVATLDTETVGHGMFYGVDNDIIMPSEHGGNHVWIYKDGKLRKGGTMPGAWSLAGCTYKGKAYIACTAKYNGAAGTNPTLHDAYDGRRVGEFPRKGIIWDMWVHQGQLVCSNNYGDDVVYRCDIEDGRLKILKTESSQARVGLSFEGSEWTGGSINSGQGQSDGRIYRDGKQVAAFDSQSSEVAEVQFGKAYIGMINRDRVVEIAKGKANVIVEWDGNNDPLFRGGWAFGIAVARTRKGQILVGRTDKSGGYIYRLD